MSEELRVDIARVQEKIGALEKTITTAHTRIDGLSADVGSELAEISKDVKALLANMHEGRGNRAAWIAVGSLSVALIGTLAKILIN